MIIVGRSSSHFTRVTRIFAKELEVETGFEVVRDLLSSEPAAYGGHPALKIPSLRAPSGTWFGALAICRELTRASRLAPEKKRIIWPEDLVDAPSSNAQELVLQAMATEVSLILSKAAGALEGSKYASKLEASLSGTMTWLEAHGPDALDALPADRALSFLGVSLFCLVTHLEFRDVLPTAPYPRLRSYCDRFGSRRSAHETAYRFDT
jgi:glutathione S-transferase